MFGAAWGDHLGHVDGHTMVSGLQNWGAGNRVKFVISGDAFEHGVSSLGILNSVCGLFTEH